MAGNADQRGSFGHAMTVRASAAAATTVIGVLVVFTYLYFSGTAWREPLVERQDTLGSGLLVYDSIGIQQVLNPSGRIHVLDSGLAEGRGLAFDGTNPPRRRLIVGDLWEGVFSYELLQAPATPEPVGHSTPLPQIQGCPYDTCDSVDHRGLLVAGNNEFLLSETHERRLAVRDLTNGRWKRTLGGPFPFDDVVDAAVDDTAAGGAAVVFAVDTKSRAHKSGTTWSGRLLRVTHSETTELDQTLSAPRGIAVSPCRARVYVADLSSQGLAWIYYSKNADTVRRSGILWSVPGRFPGDGVHHASFSGLAVSNGASRVGPAGSKTCEGEYVFAAGPDGLYILSPDGMLLAKFVVPEPVTGLAWGSADEHRLYMTVGHRLCYLATRVTGPVPSATTYRLPQPPDSPEAAGTPAPIAAAPGAATDSPGDGRPGDTSRRQKPRAIPAALQPSFATPACRCP